MILLLSLSRRRTAWSVIYYQMNCGCLWSLRQTNNRYYECQTVARSEFDLLWPPCVADADIIFLSCGFFYLLSIYLLFLAYSQPSQIRCLPYFHTWCGSSTNLGCRSETCCTRLAGNAGRKKSPKICHLRTIAQLCRAIPSQLTHVLTIGKIVKQHYPLHMSPQYGELWSTNGWDLLRVWGTPN